MPLPPLPFLMIAAWISGWFAALFVRVEDLSVLAPIDYRSLLRGVAITVIAFAVAVAALLYVRYFSAGEKMPNKAPEPTPGPVTSRADWLSEMISSRKARLAPGPVVAHL